MIPKRDKSLANPEIYQPISLLSQDVKIFSSVLTTRQNNVITNCIPKINQISPLIENFESVSEKPKILLITTNQNKLNQSFFPLMPNSISGFTLNYSKTDF